MVYWCQGKDLSWGAMLYRDDNAPCTSYISRYGVRRVAAWGDALRWIWLGSFSQHEVLIPSWGAFLGFWLFLLSWFVSRYQWFRPGQLWRWWFGVWRRFFSWLWSDYSFLFFLILWGRVRGVHSYAYSSNRYKISKKINILSINQSIHSHQVDNFSSRTY